MKLSQAAVYAAHAAAYLAGRPERDLFTCEEIARATGAPGGFLGRVVGQLVRSGLLLSVKGPHGGYRLARPAKSVTLLEIVEAVDGPVRGDSPPVGTGGLDGRLQGVMDRATGAERRQLAGVALADLADGNGAKGRPRKGN